MKIGIIPVNVGVSSVDAMIGLARKAESVGVESLWTFEHAIVPNDYSSKYPYSADGKMGVTPETNFVDPLIALSAIARETSKVRLGTGVNILPQTNPLLLAKQAASLDFVSDGRFMLGVGIGWLREEYDAMGTPFERRGARFDETSRRCAKCGRATRSSTRASTCTGRVSRATRYRSKPPSRWSSAGRRARPSNASPASARGGSLRRSAPIS